MCIADFPSSPGYRKVSGVSRWFRASQAEAPRSTSRLWTFAWVGAFHVGSSEIAAESAAVEQIEEAGPDNGDRRNLRLLV